MESTGVALQGVRGEDVQPVIVFRGISHSDGVLQPVVGFVRRQNFQKPSQIIVSVTNLVTVDVGGFERFAELVVVFRRGHKV